MAARQRMNNDRTVPPAGLLLVNPQSTLLHADGSVWRLFHPNGFEGRYWVGSQPGQRFHDLMEQARYSSTPRSVCTKGESVFCARVKAKRYLSRGSIESGRA
ncbi:MAG TPA: hypothetical protein VFS98_06010 [Methylomirabilota bacterium]|nr:hypothetical protein [Methylomirabilota bacterium]